MSEDIFAPLQSLSFRLSSAGVKANDILKNARERLKATHLRIEAWIDLEREGEENLGENVLVTQLGFAQRSVVREGPVPTVGEKERHSARWDLWISYVEENSCNGFYHYEGPYPVLECEREIRIKAAKKLPELVAALQRAGEKTISDLDEAAKKLS